MPTIKVSVTTTLRPEEVLARLTDFGPARAVAWSTVDAAGLTVHDQGPDWAEVTEGNKMGWERERYSWDAAAGTVSIETLDSNLWGPGSGWRYQLTAADGGTDVHVELNRHGKSVPGKIVGALIPVAGSWAIGRQFTSLLRKAEAH